MLIGKLAQVQILLQEGNGTTEATEFDVHLVHTFFFFFVCLSVFSFFVQTQFTSGPLFKRAFKCNPFPKWHRGFTLCVDQCSTST